MSKCSLPSLTRHRLFPSRLLSHQLLIRSARSLFLEIPSGYGHNDIGPQPRAKELSRCVQSEICTHSAARIPRIERNRHFHLLSRLRIDHRHATHSVIAQLDIALGETEVDIIAPFHLSRVPHHPSFGQQLVGRVLLATSQSDMAHKHR